MFVMSVMSKVRSIPWTALLALAAGWFLLLVLLFDQPRYLMPAAAFVAGATYFNDHVLRQASLVGSHLPLGVFLRDHDVFALADSAPDHGPDLYRGAAAAALLNWRERVLVGLRMRGILTLDVFAHDLTAPLVNQYLQIKARHLL